MTYHRKRRLTAGLLLALSLCGTVTAHASGVRVAVSPETLTVAPGDTFTVHLAVPVAGDPFNTYECTLAYDPSALAYIAQPQAVQEGPLLIDACPGHSTFYIFTPAGDSLYVMDSMMGAGCLTAGPGTLLHLTFVARGPAGVTHLRLRRARFYNDGLYVNPVQPSDAIIAVGATLGSGPVPSTGATPRLTISPNPSRGTCWLTPELSAAEGAEIRIVDVAGRLVRRLALEPRAAGRPVAWDGRDADGRAAPPGVYAAVLAGPVRPVHTLLIRLP